MSAARIKNEGRNRFSDEQIRFLEYMFETQSRPELRMKQQLANKLGLQPRQVAIWFQNKRARSKSRQAEQEYNTLKHNYEMLVSQSESLKEENQALITQMLKELEKRQQGNKIMRQGFMNKCDNKEFGGITNCSMTDNSKVVTGNYNHEISVPIDDNASYVGEDGTFSEAEKYKSSFDTDPKSWWEF